MNLRFDLLAGSINNYCLDFANTNGLQLRVLAEQLNQPVSTFHFLPNND